jgi:hypothetical protein
MPKTEFDVYCPECNILISARVVADGNGGFHSNAVNPDDEVDAEYQSKHYFVCLCGRCNQPFFICQSLYGVPAEFETVTDELVLCPSIKKLPLDGAPPIIRSAHEQAVRSFSASLFEPCVLMCRKCIEATCKILGAKGRDLNARLQSLFDAGHIDSRLLNWAHEIRLMGNEAAHETSITISKRDARDVLDFTESILIYVFSLTARFEKFRARRAKAKSKS